MYKKIYAHIYFFISIVVLLLGIRSLYNNSFISLYNEKTVDGLVEKNIIGKTKLKEIFGITNRILSPYELFGVVKQDDGYLVTYSYHDVNVEQIENKLDELNEVCNEANVDFVYVALPSKVNYADKAYVYGYEDNSVDVYEHILKYLQDNNIHNLDMVSIFRERGYTAEDIFYKTDHHWKTYMGLEAVNDIVEYLNAEFAYNMDVNLLNKENYSCNEYSDYWLGETGRKLSKSYVSVLEDYVEIVPNFDTLLHMTNVEGRYNLEGDFSIFINESDKEKSSDLYSYNAHYNYLGNNSLDSIHNFYCPEGKKVLIVKDSFSIVIIPFLSLCTSDVYVWDMRSNPDGLYDYIQENDIDLVILAYTTGWGNYMYDFK